MEFFMIITLAAMGIYFFKSTDLPRELKERSAQRQNESKSITSNFSSTPLKFTHPKSEVKIINVDNNRDAKLAELKLQKKLKEIQLLKEEIDQLTLIISDLDLELVANNEKSLEIQSIIDTHSLSLQILQEKINLLS